ncbi:hypothetical protein T02_10690 [Trichinella nativa]|uniref:Uncharacterized protein n=2 Tax=Trichinella TaxID=6333 RepID=A0A0V1L9B3_9BILA|nr:hypothetical protein T05_10238 [Trichinella murrelli]KRZ55826.1 hypothetical protein T02_10690 [Trichinella nativa]KRZ94503.1 hypothetical protein T08_10321 [Trichinella sp. T8]
MDPVSQKQISKHPLDTNDTVTNESSSAVRFDNVSHMDHSMPV